MHGTATSPTRTISSSHGHPGTQGCMLLNHKFHYMLPCCSRPYLTSLCQQEGHMFCLGCLFAGLAALVQPLAAPAAAAGMTRRCMSCCPSMSRYSRHWVGGWLSCKTSWSSCMKVRGQRDCCCIQPCCYAATLLQGCAATTLLVELVLQQLFGLLQAAPSILGS